ncbi:hypothetical protein EVAR_4635_1 [Eumeta japonica]|uniref:Reverse transcriptase domain-containing protein n=1 Tax=Eumeta variegata TaxID=151549 RepID=A0A4C1SZA8_EUMVA|nr:hypothetical protein EVAR_4635_1 [Eumeta japonica]
MHGVSSGLIQAQQSLYRGSSACLRINGAYTDWFDIRRGVRQGCVACPWLFILFVDSCLYDLRSACGLQEMVNKMNDSVKKRSMKVNFGKTKVTVFERGEGMTECDILGEDIERRVNAGNKLNGALLAIMNSKSVSRQAHLTIYNEVLILTLTSNSETSVCTEIVIESERDQNRNVLKYTWVWIQKWEHPLPWELETSCAAFEIMIEGVIGPNTRLRN